MRENEGQDKRPRVTQTATTMLRPPKFDEGTSSRQSTGDFDPGLPPRDLSRLKSSKAVAINLRYSLICL